MPGIPSSWLNGLALYPIPLSEISPKSEQELVIDKSAPLSEIKWSELPITKQDTI